MMFIKVLYESDNFLIVNKPYDLLINSDDVNEKNTLHRILLEQLSNERQIGDRLRHGFHFVHRLDFATSGVICLAKNKMAAAAAGRLFESRRADKYYLALVRGHVEEETITIRNKIGYDKTRLETNKKMCLQGENCVDPKEAISKMLVLERGSYDGEPASKVLIKPSTGRRHQLRLHCHSMGHHIVGDFMYSDGVDARPPRMFLHAYRLSLPIPGENIDVRTEDPFVYSEVQGWCPENIVNSIGDHPAEVYEKIDNFC